MAALPSCGVAISPPLALLIFLHLATTPLHARPQWRLSEGSRSSSPVAIRRLNGGDAFRGAGEQHGSCSDELCKAAGGSREGTSGDPSLRGFWGHCTCRCSKKMPAFREDLHKCTDNINECSLASFMSTMGDDSKSTAIQKIPLVFLPLKGQILHPSAALRIDALHGPRSFSSRQMVGHALPTCTVTASYFLTRNGWVHLSNITTDVISDHDPSMGINRRGQQGSLLYRETNAPFRLYEEKSHIYLKWLGELNMRELLSGRMVLVHLSCHKQGSIEIIQQCIGFRVAGTISITQGIREVTFDGQEVTGPDFGVGNGVNSNIRVENNGESTSLTTSEWVAIAAASLFLGAIYVSTVFLYLHLKNSGRGNDTEGKSGKQRRIMCGRMWRRDSSDLEECNESSPPEGIIKTNPLLLLHECHQHHKKQGGHYRQGSGNSGCVNMDGNSQNDESTDEDNELSSKTISSPNMLKTVIQMDGLSSDDDSSNKMLDKRDFHRPHRHHQITAAMVHSNSVSSSPIERLPEEDVSIIEAPQPPYHASSGHEIGLNIRSDPPDSLPPDITSDDPFVPSLFSSSPEALLAAMMGMNNPGEIDSYGQNRKKLYFNPAYFEPELLQAPPPAALEFLSKIREVISLARHRMAAKRFSPSLLGIPEVEEEDHYGTTEKKDASNNQVEPIPPCLKRENSRHTPKSKDNVIQRWLENLKSISKEDDTLPIKLHPNSVKSPAPPMKKKPKAPPAPIPIKEPAIAENAKQAMNAVIRELEVRRSVGVACKWDAKNENGFYEVDSLEKTRKTSVGDTLEVVMLNNVDSEVISVEEESSSVKLYRLPELLSRADGYSLVSEVYVNDTYNSIGSVGTDLVDMKIRETLVTPVTNECDVEKTMGDVEIGGDSQAISDAKKKGDEEVEEATEETDVKEVLTIRLEDSPSTHRRNLVPEEENFEMDTLDRKSKEESVEEESVGSTSALSDDYNYEDSLERPLRRIFLRSSGSFRSDSLGRGTNIKNYTTTSASATDLASILASSPLTRAYGSLREVYEARQRRRREQRRRRSSDAAMSIGYGPMKHNNLSAIPTWRMTRRSPGDETNFYPYRADRYNPIIGRTRESPLHLLLSPQDTMRENNQKSVYEGTSSLGKKQLGPVANSPKLQSPNLPNTNKSNHSSPTSKHIQIDPPSPTHFGYFKQDGLYTSPFCDDDDDDDSDDIDEEDPKESRMSIDSLTINNSFESDLKIAPSENLSMLTLLQHLQNQKRASHNNGTYSIGNVKERKTTNGPTSKAARVSQELQRQLMRSQQLNGNATNKKSGSSFGRGDNIEGGKPVKRTWRRLIEKREKERVAEEESSGEVRVRDADRLENQLRRIAAVDRCILERLNQRKDLKFRLEDSGYLSSSDESAIGRMSLRKGRNCAVVEAELDDADGMTKSEGDGCSDTEGESVFDGASESGAESIATDSFFGSFRVFTTAAEKAEQQQKQHQRCSSLFGTISESEGSFVNRSKIRNASEEDATDSESGGFVKVIRNSQKGSFLKANS